MELSHRDRATRLCNFACRILRGKNASLPAHVMTKRAHVATILIGVSGRVQR